MRPFLLCALPGLILAASPATATEGRFMIAAPATLTQPGSYVLTRDISSSSGPAITIQSDHVVLDLNGYSVTSTTTSVIQIAGNGKDVTIRNGRLIGNGLPDGIDFHSLTQRARVVIERVEISGVTIGVWINAAEYVEVVRCRISNVQRGILVKGFSDAFSGRFVGNAVSGIAGAPAEFVSGIETYALRGGTIRDNVITGPGSTGANAIVLEARVDFGGSIIASAGGCLVADNTVSFSVTGVGNGDGIFTGSSNNLVVHNVVKGIVGNGILSNGAGNMMLENVTSGNVNAGIAIADALARRNLLDGNLSEGNALCGISSGTTGNAYRSNMLRNNTGGAVCGPNPMFDAGSNIP
jgi:hypothetical protein